MPLYDLLCSEGHKTERMIPLAQFSEPIECPCGSPAKRVISAPMFSVEQVGYSCPVTGKWVNSGREHRENLKEQGCRVLEPGETEAASAFRQREEADFEAKLDKTVETELAKMPSEKKEQLYSELTRGGVDIAYERGPAQ